MTEQKHLKPGTEVRSANNTYVIRDVLGMGGFGITYSATYATVLNGMRVKVHVAIKEFFMKSDCERVDCSVAVSTPGTSRVEGARKDFLSEARRLNSLSGIHPNIIAVSEVFEANNTAYYVMEYVEGQSLKDYVKERGRLSQAETVAIMRSVVDAVAFLHRNHITHLDIKPANIMLATDGDGNMRPVLIDFGLSKHYDDAGQATSTINGAAYSDGYSPIEQYAGISTFSPASDVYALAATMCYCLTGQRPERAIDVDLSQIDSTLSSAGVSRSLIDVIKAGMSLRAANRPADAGCLVAMMDGHGTGSEPAPQTSLPVQDDDEHTRLSDTAAERTVEDKAPVNDTPFVPGWDEDGQDQVVDQPRKKRRVWLWCLIAILIVGVGVGAYFLLNRPKSLFAPGQAYEFYSHSNDRDYTNLIVPVNGLDTDTPVFLWCLQTVDGYWVPITTGIQEKIDGHSDFIKFTPNEGISWFKGDGNNVGFEFEALRADGDDVRVAIGYDNGPGIVGDAIFGGATEFNLTPISLNVRNQELNGTTWVYRDENWEIALTFNNNIVSIYTTDLYDGYMSVENNYYISWFDDDSNCCKLCFVADDNPADEAIAGYIDGDIIYTHRTGITGGLGNSFEFKRYFGSYLPPAPSAPEAEATAAF